MLEQRTTVSSSARPLRWPFMVAATAAAAVTALRAILGGSSDLPNMVRGLDRPEFAAVIYINWHALSVTFATLALALLAATRLPGSAARAIGTIAAIVFGATCALFMYYTYKGTGSPFTYFPWIPLSLTALISAFAVWRAQD